MPGQKVIATGLAAWLVAVGRMLFVIPPAAKASERWGVLGSFGRSPGDPQPLNDGTWLASDQATGVVYVVDAGHNRVERFNATGTYLGQFNASSTYEAEGKTETSTPAPTGALSNPAGIAVDNDPTSPSYQDVYVIDQGHNVIDKFTPTGAYLSQITGTCPTTGTCTPEAVIPFIELDGIGVASDGTVWVENGEAHHPQPALDTFSHDQPNVFLASRISQAPGVAKPGLAVDTEGNVDVVYQEARVIAKLNSIGAILGERLGEIEGTTDVAVDPETNDLFIDAGSSVAIVDPSLSLVESFGSGLLEGSAGIAVNPGEGPNGYAYITQPPDNEVLLFEHSATPQPPPAAPTTNAATNITATSAELNGELNPEGAEGGVGYHFSYNTGGAGCTEPGSAITPLDNGGLNPTGSSMVPVSTTATGLIPNTEYSFCLLADKFGATAGSQLSFTTGGVAPEVIGESASNFEEGRARFKAVINPNHSKGETNYSFEYSTEGSTTGNTLEGTIETAAGEGSIPAEEFGEREITSERVTLLPVDATYYYRVMATNETGTTVGKVQAYTKSPILSGGSASNITLSSVQLEGAVYQNFQMTKYGFEYSTSKTALETGAGTLVPGSSELGANEEETPPAPVSVNITGLQENTIYYYRLVAENASRENPQSPGKGAPVTGAIVSFTTESLPFVTTGPAEQVTRTSGALLGTVTPVDQATSYYFQYITQAGYRAALAKGATNPYAEGETTTPLNLTPNSQPQAVGPVAANGLLPETTYYYRIAAKNEFGVRYGTDHTFTTTAKVLPEATTNSATNITQTTATINGTITTNGLETAYSFEVTTTPGSYGAQTGLGATSAATATVAETLTELQPNTTYHYRLTATNIDGSARSAEQAFTTASSPSLFTTPIAQAPLAAIPPFTFPKEEPQEVKKPTKAQLLSKALKKCRKDKSKSKRTKCEKAARSKYKPAPKKHTTKK